MVKRLCEYSGKYEVQHVLHEHTQGRCKFWVDDLRNPTCMAITKIMEYPLQKVFVIEGCAGEFKNRTGLINYLEKYASWNKCDKIEITNARPGWEKLFPDYKKARIRLDKFICD